MTRIDHVEIEVPSRYDAARWYRSALGFEILEKFEFWARVDSGPLMISTDHGKTKLALFARQPQGTVRPVGIRRIALRVGGEEFLKLIEHLDGLTGTDAVRRSAVTDHEKSFSIYFADPYGNPLEVTTYQERLVRTHYDNGLR
jgi:catechol 2,3-dioxygenase-like lactoylglutathione lyase family enzyme